MLWRFFVLCFFLNGLALHAQRIEVRTEQDGTAISPKGLLHSNVIAGTGITVSKNPNGSVTLSGGGTNGGVNVKAGTNTFGHTNAGVVTISADVSRALVTNIVDALASSSTNSGSTNLGSAVGLGRGVSAGRIELKSLDVSGDSISISSNTTTATITSTAMKRLGGGSTNQTMAGSVSILATNWPGFVRNVYNVLEFGADPTGTFDSTAAFQAVLNAGYRYSLILVPPGLYNISQVITTKTASCGMTLRGMGFSVGGSYLIGDEAILLWKNGATNGGPILFSDSQEAPKYENLHFECTWENTPASLVRVDQVMGGGTSTEGLFYNCGFRSTHTNYLHRIKLFDFSPVSQSNCEHWRWLGCYFGGGNGSAGSFTNHTLGLVVGDNANALDLEIRNSNIQNCTNGICKTNGSILITSVLTTGNAVDIWFKNLVDWNVVDRIRSEQYRQFCVVAAGDATFGTGISFKNIGVADGSGWNTNFPVFDIQGSTHLSFDTVNGGGAGANNRPLQPFISFSGSGISSTIWKLDNVQSATNNLRDFLRVAYINPTRDLLPNTTEDGRPVVTFLNGISKVAPSFTRATNLIDMDTNSGNIKIGGEWNSVTIGTNDAQGYDVRVFSRRAGWKGFGFGDTLNPFRVKIGDEGDTNSTWGTVSAGSGDGAHWRVANSDGTVVADLTTASGLPGISMSGAFFLRVNGGTYNMIVNDRQVIFPNTISVSVPSHLNVSSNLTVSGRINAVNTPGSGSLIALDGDGYGFKTNLIDLTLRTVTLTNSPGSDALTITSTNGNTTVLRTTAPSVSQTQTIGAVYFASASSAQIDVRSGDSFMLTNLLAHNITLYLTNYGVNNRMSVKLRGAASGGTDYTVSVLSGAGDDISWNFHTPTNGATGFTITNGMSGEIDFWVTKEYATNVVNAIYGLNRR